MFISWVFNHSILSIILWVFFVLWILSALITCLVGCLFYQKRRQLYRSFAELIQLNLLRERNTPFFERFALDTLHFFSMAITPILNIRLLLHVIRLFRVTPFIDYQQNIDLNRVALCEHCGLRSRYHQGNLTLQLEHDSICPFCQKVGLAFTIHDTEFIALAPQLSDKEIHEFKQSTFTRILNNKKNELLQQQLLKEEEHRLLRTKINDEQMKRYTELIQSLNEEVRN